METFFWFRKNRKKFRGKTLLPVETLKQVTKRRSETSASSVVQFFSLSVLKTLKWGRNLSFPRGEDITFEGVDGHDGAMAQ